MFSHPGWREWPSAARFQIGSPTQVGGGHCSPLTGLRGLRTQRRPAQVAPQRGFLRNMVSQGGLLTWARALREEAAGIFPGRRERLNLPIALGTASLYRLNLPVSNGTLVPKCGLPCLGSGLPKLPRAVDIGPRTRAVGHAAFCTTCPPSSSRRLLAHNRPVSSATRPHCPKITPGLLMARLIHAPLTSIRYLALYTIYRKSQALGLFNY